MLSFDNPFKFNNIFIFLYYEFSLVLLPFGWIPLSDEFVASYLLVDSLGGEVYRLFSYLLGGFS